jgi:undecaprenyl phosphate N,N'-diacetylbacillosamine 1-phosphate transferase
MYKKYIKRFFDIIISLIFLPLILPAILIFALLIKLEDRGPVFYTANRLGRDEKIFKMYKLRSMNVNSPDIRNEDGSTYNAENDPRVTKVGRFIRKTSLDELPQLLNVLIGNMSLIGPRPDLPEDINYYEGDEIRRLEVLPGISGYSQAYFRNSIEWKEKIKNDIYYIKNISFWLDVKIFIKTVHSVILQKGIYVIKQNHSDNEAKTLTM